MSKLLNIHGGPKDVPTDALDEEMVEKEMALEDAIFDKIDKLHRRGSAKKAVEEFQTGLKHLQGQHDQKRHGGGSGGGQAMMAGPDHESVTAAVKAGKVTTVQAMHVDDHITAWAKAGEPVNMAMLQVVGTKNLFNKCTMCVPRESMPVIPGEAEPISRFAGKLKAAGIGAVYETVDPRTLTATQNQLDGVKVGGIYGALKSGKLVDETTLVIDRNGGILDGHHRWAAHAVLAMDKQGHTVKVLRADAEIERLYKLGHEFDKELGIETKPFGMKAWIQGMKQKTTFKQFEDAPGPPPDPSKPYLWFDGQWLLLATDDADGVPRTLDLPTSSGPARSATKELGEKIGRCC